MSAPYLRFPFIDAVHAAEILHITRDEVLDLIASGRLNAYAGKPDNPFLRSGDVAAIAEERGIGQDEAPKRAKSGSSKVQARLTADSRWTDISDDDIRQWALRADPARRQAARKVAVSARDQLARVLALLDEQS